MSVLVSTYFSVPYTSNCYAEAMSDSGLIEPDKTPGAVGDEFRSHESSSYFVRHWRGDMSLPRSFWVNMCLLNIGVSILGKIFYDVPITSVAVSAAYILAYWIFMLCLAIWQYVGVWRAATRHAVTGNTRTAANLAKAVIILFSVLSAAGMYKGVVPQMLEAVSMVTGDSKIEDYKITVLPNGKAVEFYGGIKLGAAKRLAEVLSSAPYVSTIYIETLGGRYGEAVQMARIIKEKQLSTYVPRMCLSSGVVMFLAGKERVIRRGAKLGFHSASFAGQKFEDDGINKLYKDAGVSSSFLARANSTLEFWYPSTEELLNEHIVTRVTEGGDFGIGTVELKENTLEAFRNSILAERRYNALASVKPAAFEQCIEEAYRRVQAGEDLLKAAENLNALFFRTVTERFSSPSDAAVRMWIKFNIKLLEDNLEISPANVLLKLNSAPEAQAWTGPELERRIPKWPKQIEQEVCVVLLQTPPIRITAESRAKAEEEISKMFNEIFTPGELQIISEVPLPKDPQNLELSCKLQLRFYRALLDSSQAPIVGRYLLSAE